MSDSIPEADAHLRELISRACAGEVIVASHPSGKPEDGACTIMPNSLEVDGVWVTPRHLVDRFAEVVNSIKRDYAEKEARMEKVVATIGGLSADIDRLAEYNRIIADKNEALKIECRRLKGKYPGWYALNEAMPEILDAPETVISGNRRSNPVACIAPGRYWVGCLIEDRTSNKTTRVIWGRIHKGSLEYLHDRTLWPTHWSVIPV